MKIGEHEEAFEDMFFFGMFLRSDIKSGYHSHAWHYTLACNCFKMPKPSFLLPQAAIQSKEVYGNLALQGFKKDISVFGVFVVLALPLIWLGTNV